MKWEKTKVGKCMWIKSQWPTSWQSGLFLVTYFFWRGGFQKVHKCIFYFIQFSDWNKVCISLWTSLMRKGSCWITMTLDKITQPLATKTVGVTVSASHSGSANYVILKNSLPLSDKEIWSNVPSHTFMVLQPEFVDKRPSVYGIEGISWFMIYVMITA